MTKAPLTDTLVPVIKTKDIMEKFNVSRGTALKILEQEELHSYYIGKSLVCEREYFDKFVGKLNNTNEMRLFS